MRSVAASVRIAVGIDVSVRDASVEDALALDPVRGQLDSRRILAELRDICAPDERVLGVADRDLYSTVFSYVFGEARLGGRVAIVSTYRLRPEYSGHPADDLLLQQRLSKECLHEIGHMFGLVHCTDPGCVMRFSGTVTEIDSKSEDYCDPCLEALVRQRSDRALE